ncbi:hypothetical protein AB0910_24540 [Streptomyces sp. NPDC047002]|uniref:RcpC/CpaB family pilus assembly protein n=1 Tax=Streptomyces sp. NPDC047002 TaxID=3155475 RepID=UPI0034514F06
MPEPRGVPAFDPVRVRGQRDRLRRAVLRRQRVMAAGLAVGAAALAATGAGTTGAAGPASSRTGADARAGAGGHAGVRAHTDGRQGTPDGTGPAAGPPDGSAERSVSAPVRIADAATVRLLRPGDRVDVIAAPAAVPGAPGIADRRPEARTVASGVRVEEIPEAGPDDPVEGGALLVLSVSRQVAAELAAAAPMSQLAVTLC